MTNIPRDRALDGTLGILQDGYEFIWRCQAYHSEIFLTRFVGKKAVCVHGPEAAALFYDESKLQRRQAVPRRVVTSLFGKGAVQRVGDSARARYGRARRPSAAIAEPHGSARRREG